MLPALTYTHLQQKKVLIFSSFFYSLFFEEYAAQRNSHSPRKRFPATFTLKHKENEFYKNTVFMTNQPLL